MDNISLNLRSTADVASGAFSESKARLKILGHPVALGVFKIKHVDQKFTTSHLLKVFFSVPKNGN